MSREPTPCRYKVRGQLLAGFVVERVGDDLLLNVAPLHWLVARLRIYARSELILVAGREPAGETS